MLSTGSLHLNLELSDYVTKPFSPREVMLRVNAIFETPEWRREGSERYDRRSKIDSRSHNRFGVWQSRSSKPRWNLSCKAHLIAPSGRVQPRDRLLTEVWGYEHASTHSRRTIDTSRPKDYEENLAEPACSSKPSAASAIASVENDPGAARTATASQRSISTGESVACL